MLKLVKIGLFCSAMLGLSATTAAACGAFTAEPGFATKQVITWTNGNRWTCWTDINKDNIKFFTKGTVARYEIDMANNDNCTLYRNYANATEWVRWFRPASYQNQVYTRDQVGTNVDGIRLGC
jgi:hypothetical protein